MAVGKATADLERIGNECSRIVLTTIAVSGRSAQGLQPRLHRDIKKMAGVVSDLLRHSLHALDTGDADEAS